MHLSTRQWYIAFALIALAPIGVRVLTWQRQGSTPVDPAMASAGQVLFLHEWKPHDPLANGGDGLGPVYNATSCLACHNKGGVGGAGGADTNVTLFAIAAKSPGGKSREGVIHKHAVRDADRESPVLVGGSAVSGRGRQPNGCKSMPGSPGSTEISERNTPALFGDKLIDEIPERLILANERAQKLKCGMPKARTTDAPAGRALRLANGRVGRFGWKAQSASLADFVQAACANELGLGNPGQAQPAPLPRPSYTSTGLDLTLDQCDQLTSFVASLRRPEQIMPDDSAARTRVEVGKKLFSQVGCADCHQETIGSVDGIYSDLLLHSMGQALQANGSYNQRPPPDPDGEPPDDVPAPDEWRTPPLWGVADSAPYMHDGRAATLQDAILAHGGQGEKATKAFVSLPLDQQKALIEFLDTLKAPR